jgi:hypothetical protein
MIINFDVTVLEKESGQVDGKDVENMIIIKRKGTNI